MKPVAQACAWRDEGLSRDEVSARLAAQGLDAGSVGIVLANVFPSPLEGAQAEPSDVTRRIASGLAVVAAMAGAVSLMGVVGIALQVSARPGVGWLALIGNAVSVVCCIITGVLDSERAKAIRFSRVAAAAVVATPVAVLTYVNVIADSRPGMKGGPEGDMIVAFVFAGLALAVSIYFVTIPLFAFGMVTSGRR